MREDACFYCGKICLVDEYDDKTFRKCVCPRCEKKRKEVSKW